jgi:predicted porin
MNKKLLAVALATAFAAPAMAEGVQIYGAFDVGVLVRGGNEGKVDDFRDTRSTVSSGMNGHNFIGFKMSENLGNGLSIAGDAQFGFTLDASDATATGAGNGNFRTITSTLALIGDHGVLVAGKTGGARAAWIKKYDPFGGFGVASAASTTGIGIGEAYANNVIAWVTPEILPGLKGLFAYTSSLDQQDSYPTKSSTGRLYAIAAMYDAGPLSLVLNYENLEYSKAVSGATKNAGYPQIYTAGASYDFGVVKVSALYDQITQYGYGWQAGLAAPVSDQLTLKAAYSEGQRRGYLRPTDGDVEGDGKCSKVGVGMTYDLSKRTRFYADAATLIDAKATHCALNTNFDIIGNSGSSDNAQSGAYGATGFNAGIRHSF